MSDQESGAAIGFTAFAGVLLTLIGAFQIILGLTALVNDEFYVVGEEWILQFDVTTWGWIHLLFGIVVLLAGIWIFRGAVWARTVGVLLAGLSALIAFAWLPYYPVWSIVIIALDVAVIWALTAHGRDLARSVGR